MSFDAWCDNMLLLFLKCNLSNYTQEKKAMARTCYELNCAKNNLLKP